MVRYTFPDEKYPCSSGRGIRSVGIGLFPNDQVFRYAPEFCGIGDFERYQFVFARCERVTLFGVRGEQLGLFAARFDSGQIPQVGRGECRFVEVAIHDALGFEESVAFDDASLLELLHIGDAEPDDIELTILFLDRSFLAGSDFVQSGDVLVELLDRTGELLDLDVFLGQLGLKRFDLCDFPGHFFLQTFDRPGQRSVLAAALCELCFEFGDSLLVLEQDTLDLVDLRYHLLFFVQRLVFDVAYLSHHAVFDFADRLKSGFDLIEDFQRLIVLLLDGEQRVPLGEQGLVFSRFFDA